jgi:hypothetical protein
MPVYNHAASGNFLENACAIGKLENPVLTTDQHGLPLIGETAEEKADSSLRFGMTSARATIRHSLLDGKGERTYTLLFRIGERALHS